MKKAKRILSIMLVMALVLGFMPSTKVNAASPKLNAKKMTIELGSVGWLYVSNYYKTVKWSSSNKKVATVSNYGNVTAKGEGKATITAKCGKKKLTCKVTVTYSDENKLNNVNNWRSDYWTEFVELYYYQKNQDGTGISGAMNVELQLKKYDKVYAQITEMDKLMKSLKDSKYDDIKEVWDLLKSEIDKQAVLIHSADWTVLPVNISINRDLYDQYDETFLDYYYND